MFLPGVDDVLYMSTSGFAYPPGTLVQLDMTAIIMEIREELKKRFGYDNVARIDYVGVPEEKLKEFIESLVKYKKCICCGRCPVDPVQTEHGRGLVAITFECLCGARLVIWVRK